MPLITRQGKGSKLTIAEMDGNLLYLESLSQQVGTNYLSVPAFGTDVENATELQSTYDAAKGMTPSSSSKITVIANPGYYNFGTSSFTMDTEYIDLVSLDGNRSIIFNSTSSSGTINITANNIFVKGVNVGTKEFIVSSSAIVQIENCEGGDYSFSGDGRTASGTFINCQGGDYSFGGNAGTASGIFMSCVGGNDSFGGRGGTADGVFTNCIGGDDSFGGVGGTLSGKLYYCRLTAGTFETVSGNGRVYYSVDGDGNPNEQ
jgi:hypothetical protein